MKIRNGFVSNSSSSSFIIAVKKDSDAIGTVTITKEIDLSKYVETKIETAEDLYDYFREQYSDKEYWSKETTKNYKLGLKEISNGKVIMTGSFSDEGTEPEEYMLCLEGLRGLTSDNITVIESEGGY